MLDFIVERKRVDDLWSSIKDNRYKQQKLRLQVTISLRFMSVFFAALQHVFILLHVTKIWSFCSFLFLRIHVAADFCNQ